MSTTVKLHSQIIGQGQPVIVLHGAFGSGDNLKLLTRLNSPTEKFQFHFLDLRNHGRSPHADGMSFPTLADDVFSYCDDQGIEKFSIVGHSLGGKVGMACALKSPTRIHRMVSVDMAPINQSPTNVKNQKANLMGAQAVACAQIKSRAEADELMKPHIFSQLVRQFFSKSLTRNSQGYLVWLFDAERLINFSSQWLVDLNPLDYIQQYSDPALFLYGVKSRFVSPSAQPTIQSLFPNAEMIGIDDAGHWVHSDQPQRFLEELGFFLAPLSEL